MVSEYKISNYEFGKIADERIGGTTISKAKVIIPKLMTNMTTGLYEKKMVVNRNLFANAPDCKISVPATIQCQGYYTVEKYSTEIINLSNKAIKDGSGRTYIPKNTPVMLEVLYEDLLNIHLIGKE
jgi:hypothetical protein